jgi:hypothetical protein
MRYKACGDLEPGDQLQDGTVVSVRRSNAGTTVVVVVEHLMEGKPVRRTEYQEAFDQKVVLN